jgi:hypothetical protein
MDAITILALVNGFISMGFNVWKSARQVLGEETIPSWDDIIAKNKELQDKIDAEK